MANFDSTVLNLKGNAYMTAISQLESKLRELENARSDYEAQRDKIRDFWTGDAADSAYEVIAESISKVKTAYQNVQENVRALQQAQEDATSINAQGVQTLDDARKSIQGLF